MITEEEIREKNEQWYNLPWAIKSNLRNIGFVDALKWVLESEATND